MVRHYIWFLTIHCSWWLIYFVCFIGYLFYVFIGLFIDFISDIFGYRWKIQGLISCKHPKRVYSNANGTGEVSTWDLVDHTGSINLVAFNLNSNLMCNKLTEGKVRMIETIYFFLTRQYLVIWIQRIIYSNSRWSLQNSTACISTGSDKFH